MYYMTRYAIIDKIFRVVTRGMYPKLVRDNVKKNMETLAAVGVENYVIQGKLERFCNENVFKISFKVY